MHKTHGQHLSINLIVLRCFVTMIKKKQVVEFRFYMLHSRQKNNNIHEMTVKCLDLQFAVQTLNETFLGSLYNNNA